MRVKLEHLPAVFAEMQKVREYLATYCEGADKVPVSLDDITVAIKELYEVEIETRIVPFNTTLLRGMIEIYEGRAVIYIDAALNLQGTRYVFVKEACHIMLLNAKNATKDPAKIIDYYVHNRPENDDGSHPDEIICEEVTKYAAAELLFPPSLREAAKAKINAKTETLFTIGEKLLLPINLVEFVLADWYMDLSSKFRNDHPDKERFAAPAKK